MSDQPIQRYRLAVRTNGECAVYDAEQKKVARFAAWQYAVSTMSMLRAGIVMGFEGLEWENAGEGWNIANEADPGKEA